MMAASGVAGWFDSGSRNQCSMSDDFSRIGPPWWDGKPVAIVGNGPSLKGFDYERLRGFHVLAVKGQMFNIPWADAGFGLDIPRYIEWCGMLNTVRYPVYWATPKMKLLGPGPHAPCIRFLRRIDLSELSDDPAAICSGGTSGFGALNVAWLKRARRIVLLGFEYNGDCGHADTRAYINSREQNGPRWHQWANNFGMARRRLEVAGVKIINAAPKSRITAFPRTDIDAALRELANA
jgi:hypothetical protein